MQTINLQKIIELAELDKKELASHLFPDLKHPSRSIAAVIAGNLLLDSVQISKLANLIQVPAGMLFEDADWSMGVPANKLSELYSSRLTTTLPSWISLL